MACGCIICNIIILAGPLVLLRKPSNPCSYPYSLARHVLWLVAGGWALLLFYVCSHGKMLDCFRVGSSCMEMVMLIIAVVGDIVVSGAAVVLLVLVLVVW